MDRQNSMGKQQNEKYEDILMAKWLQQQQEDEAIENYREILQPEEPQVSAFQTREIQQISQKLNRLERNFLWQKQVRKETKTQQSVNDSILDLDSLYQQAVQLIATMKLKKKQENKEVVGQIISLYNHSAQELTKRQKIEKEIKVKKMRVEQLKNKKDMVRQENSQIQEEIQQRRAEHWMKMKTFQRMAALRL